MPVTGKGFDQCYNAQAAADTESLLATHVHVTQVTNDKQQVMPLLTAWQGYPETLGKPTTCWVIPATSVPAISRPAMTMVSNRCWR